MGIFDVTPDSFVANTAAVSVPAVPVEPGVGGSVFDGLLAAALGRHGAAHTAQVTVIDGHARRLSQAGVAAAADFEQMQARNTANLGGF